MQSSEIYPKAEARCLVSSRLSSLSDQEYELLSRATCKNLSTLLHNIYKEQPFSLVLSYVAKPAWREVGVKPLEQEFTQVKFDYAPASADAPLPSAHYDLILVPLLGYNHENYRLGRGGGWYDRLLSQQPRATFIGVGLSLGLIGFKGEQHDIPMHYLITESTSR